MEHWPLSALVPTPTGRYGKFVKLASRSVSLPARGYGTIRLCDFTATGKFRVSLSQSIIASMKDGVTFPYSTQFNAVVRCYHLTHPLDDPNQIPVARVTKSCVHSHAACVL